LTVVDASVLAPSLIDSWPDGDEARARLRGCELHAPEVVDLEIASMLRKAIAAGKLDDAGALQALGWLADIPLERHSHVSLLSRIWELRDNVTPYDAAYIALAERLGSTLLTVDARLARAPGTRCAIEVLA
jgi:predicted nucleic acid-binding protein